MECTSRQTYQHPIYGNWGVEEKHGILDTEWTLKFTELLKVEVDRHMVNSGFEHGSLARNLDQLKREDFQRAACYKRIENLNNVTIKNKQIRESIETQENILHDLFSKLKTAQSDLVKCLDRITINNTQRRIYKIIVNQKVEMLTSLHVQLKKLKKLLPQQKQKMKLNLI